MTQSGRQPKSLSCLSEATAKQFSDCELVERSEPLVEPLNGRLETDLEQSVLTMPTLDMFERIAQEEIIPNSISSSITMHA